MDKIKLFLWGLLILFIVFAKDYTNKIQYPENIMYFYEELPVGQQEIKIFADDHPVAYPEIKVHYETFKEIHTNDFNMNYKFVSHNKNNVVVLFRIIRLATTLN